DGDDAGADSAAYATTLQRVADAFGVHLTALQQGSAVAVLGDRAYGTVPVAADGDPAARGRRIAQAFLDRIGPNVPAVIGIGPLAPDAATLATARQGADRALRVLRHEPGARRVATSEDVLIDSLLLDLADLASARREGVMPPIARLLAYDAEHQAQLVETLRAWLDTFGDLPAAAAQMYVHPNTYRYRIRRVAEVSGLDLKDPRERFAAMVQLRLLDP
ncbi:PucR family transcriptional regulator, partial [Pimelobacter simplex]